MSKFYVNMGRWANHVIGPFDSEADAEDHIDGLSWRGQRPTVVTIAEPVIPKREWRVAFVQYRDAKGEIKSSPARTTLSYATVTVEAHDVSEATLLGRQLIGDEQVNGHYRWYYVNTVVA